MKLGFIVNPIAGMGGKVGLRGTDNVLKEAVGKGAEPIAPRRATEFLQKLADRTRDVKLEMIACPSIMGKDEADAAKFPVQVLPMKIGKKTTARDTKRAVELLALARVDLIIFVGGDGTAKDIFDTLQGFGEVPVLGVPSGVKMYSGVFAVNLSDAADVVEAFVQDQAEIAEFEIMDADEQAIRDDSFSVKLHGFVKTPFLPARIQGSKQVSPETTDEKDSQTATARFIIEEMQPDGTYILGPGTTVRRIAELLGVRKTLLGVDIYRKGKVTLDADERTILREVNDWKCTWVVLSPIGHQGILLGRGNQQISPEIIRRVGKDKIIVATTRSKIQSIEGGVLRVDTGDNKVDNMLRGHIRVVTDYREWRLVKVQ